MTAVKLAKSKGATHYFQDRYGTVGVYNKDGFIEWYWKKKNKWVLCGLTRDGLGCPEYRAERHQREMFGR